MRSQTETDDSQDSGMPRWTQYLSRGTRFLRLQVTEDKTVMELYPGVN